MQLQKIITKMIDFYDGNISDINHCIKVHAFASLIGKLEKLSDDEQFTLELAAVCHDIACPLCRIKYGDTAGHHQEIESEALLRDFLEEFSLPEKTEERVIFLVTHHHTYTNVEGRDYQILLEADYIVNAGESEKWAKQADKFRTNVFKTSSGIRLLDSVFKNGNTTVNE